LTHLLFHTSSTVGVGQLVRLLCDPVKPQKGFQRSPLLDTIMRWPFSVLPVVSPPMTDATHRYQSDLFRGMHILTEPLKLNSEIKFECDLSVCAPQTFVIVRSSPVSSDWEYP